MKSTKFFVFSILAAILVCPGFLLAAEKPEIFPQLGHSWGVASVVFSPDGRHVLSGSRDKSLKLWDVATGREIRTFPGHDSSATSLAFSRDGRYAMSMGQTTHDLKLWDVATAKEIPWPAELDKSIGAAAFSPDGRSILFSGYYDNMQRKYEVKRWEIATGRVQNQFEMEYSARAIVFSPDGRQVLYGGKSNWFYLLDAATGRKIRSFYASPEWIDALAFRADGKQVLSYSDVYNSVRLWDVATGNEIRKFPSKERGVKCVTFSPDGRQVLAGSIYSHILSMALWDVESGREIRIFKGHTETVNAVAFSPDGRLAVSGSDDKTLKLWDVATGSEIRSFRGYTNPVFSVALSPDGRLALSGCFDKTLKLWDVATGKKIRTFHAGTLQWVYLHTAEQKAAFARQGHTENVYAVAFSPDGKLALSGSYDQTMKLWDVATGRVLRTFRGHTNGVGAVAFSPDGRIALSGSWDKTMKLWEVATGREIRTIPGPHHIIEAVAFTPDGEHFVAGYQAQVGYRGLGLWETNTGRLVRQYEGHYLYTSVNTVAVSPDGKYTLSGGAYDGTARLNDLSSGKLIRTLRGHTRTIRSVAFSPDGKYALSGGEDKTMKLWEVVTGREIRTFAGYATEIRSVAFGPDGKRILSGSDSGAATLWDVDSGRQVAQMIEFSDGEWVTVTPEGYFDASPNGARHMTVRVGENAYGIDQFSAKFYRPELVQLALAGKALPQGESLGEVVAKKAAPTVLIVSPSSGAAVDRGSVAVHLRITDNGGGIGNVNIYLNGSQVANDTRAVTVKETAPAGETRMSFTISLMDGVNDIKVVALNLDGSMESIPAVVRVLSKTVLAKPNLYALVVGINEYKNKSIALSYAVPDALAFAQALEKAAAPLFGKTEIATRTTARETTKEAISKAFANLRPRIKPNDLFVFYDASHGVVDVVDNQEQYFLLTSNVLLLSSRHIGRDAISQKELSSLIGSIPAQKKLVILDTCNAGKGGKEVQIALLQQTRGLTEATAVKLLQRSIGSAVFSASSDSQQALEGYKGHGLFTYVLLEGLRGKADIKKDGYITVLGLADYVEENVIRLSEEVFKRQQTPTIQTGANFPIGKIR